MMDFKKLLPFVLYTSPVRDELRAKARALGLESSAPKPAMSPKRAFALMAMLQNPNSTSSTKFQTQIPVTPAPSKPSDTPIGLPLTNEVKLLQSFPAETFSTIAKQNQPNSAGLVGHNAKNGWLHVGFQRGAMTGLVHGAATGNKAEVDKAWTAIDAAFSRQTEDGNFLQGNLAGAKHVDDLMGNSFWLAELSHALLTLKQSDLGDEYQAKIEALKPKIAKSAQWLLNDKATLMQFDQTAPNRLFYDAMAFGLTGKLLNDDTLIQTGKDFAAKGLQLQDEAGVFEEHGGSDSSYQAVSLLKLQQYGQYFPSERISQAVTKGVDWELSKIKPSGEVDVSGNVRTGNGQETVLGRAKDVDYGAVVQALLYYGAQNQAPSVTQKATTSLNYILANPPQ